jgi:hypothetical protein
MEYLRVGTLQEGWRRVGAAARRSATDASGNTVELRIVNSRTGRGVPRDRVRMLPTAATTDPNMTPHTRAKQPVGVPAMTPDNPMVLDHVS